MASNFTTRLLVSLAWPSATKMLPSSATTTSAGELKCPLPPPASPGVPSRMRTSPVGLNLTTWCPRLPPSGVFASPTPSVTQTLPSGSTSMPCGQMNMPPPKLSTAVPSGANLMIESRSEFRALASEVLRSGVAAQHRPDVLAVVVDRRVPDRADDAAVGELRPVVDQAVGVGVGLAGRVGGGAQRNCNDDGGGDSKAIHSRHDQHST